MTSLKASLVGGEERLNKASEEVVRACQAFKADREVLRHKKDDQISALKSLIEEVPTPWKGSRESSQRVIDALTP